MGKRTAKQSLRKKKRKRQSFTGKKKQEKGLEKGGESILVEKTTKGVTRRKTGVGGKNNRPSKKRKRT